MTIEDLATELGEIRHNQNSKKILKERIDSGLDDKIENELLTIGFAKVEGKGRNTVFYHENGHLFNFDVQCEGCGCYDYERRYKLLKINKPKNQNNVNWAIKGANRMNNITRRMLPLSVLMGITGGGIGYSILERILDKPSEANVAVSFCAGAIAYGLSFLATLIHFDYKTEKATETLADNSYDAIEKVREIF